jgi:hypothetical protein
MPDDGIDVVYKLQGVGERVGDMGDAEIDADNTWRRLEVSRQ